MRHLTAKTLTIGGIGAGILVAGGVCVGVGSGIVTGVGICLLATGTITCWCATIPYCKWMREATEPMSAIQVERNPLPLDCPRPPCIDCESNTVIAFEEEPDHKNYTKCCL